LTGGGVVDPAKVRALCIAQGVPVAVVDSFQGANTQVQELSGGNPNLQAERGNTYTAGFVIQPHFGIPLLDRMQVSLDWYSIEVNGYITTIPASAQLQGCFNENGANPTYSPSNQFCTMFNRDPATGQIVSGTQQLANAAVLRTDGIDGQLDWRIRLSDIPAMHLSDRWGSLRLNATVSWLGDMWYRNYAGGQTVQYRGSIGSQDISGATVGDAYAVWKGLINATYTYGPVDLGLVERYIGAMKDASCVNASSCTARGADPTFYTDVNLRWRLTDTLELRGGVTNAFNQVPRFFTSASASQGQTDASTYDLIGRRYFLALKARF
jgi:outer membrane receptor protein involved in Fe transport